MNFLSPKLSQNTETFFKKIFIIYSKVVRIQNQSSAESAKIYRINQSNSFDYLRIKDCQSI